MFSLQSMSGGINLIVNAILSKDMLEDICSQPASSEVQSRLSKTKKMGKYLLISGLGGLALIPTGAFAAYSYFGMKNFVEKFGFSPGAGSISLGGLTAFGNVIPGLAFVYRGVKFVTSTILEAEYGWPSVPMCVVMSFIPLSGFASYQAMEEVLNNSQVEDKSLILWLAILANLGTVITCNGPIAMIWCKNIFGSQPQTKLQLPLSEPGSSEEGFRLVVIEDGQSKSELQSSEVGHGAGKQTGSLVTVYNGQPRGNRTSSAGALTKAGVFRDSSQSVNRLADQKLAENDSQRMVRFNSA